MQKITLAVRCCYAPVMYVVCDVQCIWASLLTVWKRCSWLYSAFITSTL